MKSDPFFAAISSAVLVVFIAFLAVLLGQVARRLFGGSVVMAQASSVAFFLLLFFISRALRTA
jgi:hypothetical protein